MSPKVPDLAARAQAARKSREAKKAERPATPVTRTKPVRVSLHMDPQQHRFLMDFAQEVGEQAERPRVPHVKILRALVDELERDPDLRLRISDAVIDSLDV